jgi:heme-degrading monooxygenase HmoA
LILEAAILSVRPGTTAAFETAMSAARPLIAASPGFRSIEVRRGIERPDTYLLLVGWDSVADHEAGFRGSPRYAEWRALLHHFYDPMPVVEHYGDALG